MQDRTTQLSEQRPSHDSVHDSRIEPKELQNLHEIVAKARQNLNQNDWDYIVGGV
jgi:hypothetical protein